MKITHIIIMLLAVLLLVSPASAWIAGYSGRQAVNTLGDATWTGNATNYQILVYVSNANGVSSGNTIYLNGTGASFKDVNGIAIINDLRFTDSSDNLYSYWIEHTAATNSYWPVWVKIPTIYKNTSTQTYVYYGNSAASSIEDINNTFIIGDDFNEATINTTKWSYNATQATVALSGSIATVSSPYNYGLYSNLHIPAGYEMRAYVSKSPSAVSASWGFTNASAVGAGEQSGYLLWYMNTAAAAQSPNAGIAGDSSTVQFTSANGAPFVYNVYRPNSSQVIFSMSDGAYQLRNDPSTYAWTKGGNANNMSLWLGGDNTAGKILSVDWVMARQRLTPAPSVSIGNAGPTPWFIANKTSGSSPTYIQFTDQSYGYPTSWQWNFGDGSTPAEQFTQSPAHLYQTDGTFNVTLTAGNVNGTVTVVRNAYITLSTQNNTGYGQYYAAKTVTFHIQSAFGAPIAGATVTATGVSTSMGAWDWVGQLLGIKLDETPINTQTMTATTDTNGDAQFMVLPTVYYNITIFKTGTIDKTIFVTPADDKYVVIADWSIFGTSGKDVLAVDSFNVTASESTGHISVTGNDTLNHFTGGIVYLNQTTIGANLTAETTIQSQAIPTSNFTLGFDVTNYHGKSYSIHIRANQSDFGVVSYDRGITFKPEKKNPMGLDNKTLMFLSIIILIGTGAIFTATTAHNGGLLTCFVGWILYALGWLDYAGDSILTGLILATVISVAVIIVVARSKS